MIAARLAGGNLFFAFLVVGDFLWWGILGALGALGALGFFLRGFCGGEFLEHSEHSDFFLRGFFCGGILFFGGWWGVFWIVSVGKN